MRVDRRDRDQLTLFAIRSKIANGTNAAVGAKSVHAGSGIQARVFQTFVNVCKYKINGEMRQVAHGISNLTPLREDNLKGASKRLGLAVFWK